MHRPTFSNPESAHRRRRLGAAPVGTLENGRSLEEAMKAVVVTGPDLAPFTPISPDPTPGDGFVVADLVAAGIHNIVRSRASGRHYSSTAVWLLIPGIDAVVRTGDGRLVYTATQAVPYGTMAEHIPTSEAFAIAVPEGTDPLAVAAGCNPGLASWMPLRSRRDALADSGGLATVLVLGVTGMAGRIAVDNALAMGATTVVGVGRNSEVLEELTRTHGPALRTVALTGTDGDADAIRDALEGQAPTTVIDFLWGPVAEQTFAAVGSSPTTPLSPHRDRHDGRGRRPVPGALLRSRHYTLSGSGLGSVDVSAIFTGLPNSSTGSATVP